MALNLLFQSLLIRFFICTLCLYIYRNISFLITTLFGAHVFFCISRSNLVYSKLLWRCLILISLRKQFFLQKYFFLCIIDLFYLARKIMGIYIALKYTPILFAYHQKLFSLAFLLFFVLKLSTSMINIEEVENIPPRLSRAFNKKADSFSLGTPTFFFFFFLLIIVLHSSCRLV